MIYNDAELKEKIHEMLKDFETEVVEFKEANNSYSFKEIGKYFSALGNEANIRGMSEGWLIFGITNKSIKFFINVDFPVLTGPNYSNIYIAICTHCNILI